MKILKKIIVVGLVTIFPVLALGAGVQMKFIYRKGSVQISRAGKTQLYKWNQIPKAGIRLAVGDKLRIGPNATVGVSFLDTGDHVLLYANSLFVIQQVKKEKSIVDLWLGKAKFLVKKLLISGQQRFQVRTRGSIIGVKGTEFWVNTANQETSVLCLEGEVEFRSEQFPTVAVSIKANQLSLLSSGSQKPLPSVTLTKESVQNVDQAWDEDQPVDVKKVYQESPEATVQISSLNQDNEEANTEEEIQQEESSEDSASNPQIVEIPEVEIVTPPQVPDVSVPDPVKKDERIKFKL